MRDRWNKLSHIASLLLAVFVICLGGCSRSTARPIGQEDRVVVFAATSLREAFTAIGAAFKQVRPGVEVTFHFAGTQELRTQLEHGARADVFASADQRHMAALVHGSLATGPIVFARNEPVIVVSTDATTIRGLVDLPLADRIVLGTPEVPIGGYSLEIFDRAASTLGSDFRARIESKVVSRELNVRQVLMKVSLGEAQAGIVYRTDVALAPKGVRVLDIAPEVNVRAEYPMAVVTGAAHPELARAWVNFVMSAEAQKLLATAGFLAPLAPGVSP